MVPPPPEAKKTSTGSRCLSSAAAAAVVADLTSVAYPAASGARTSLESMGGANPGDSLLTRTQQLGGRPSMVLFERASKQWWNMRFSSRSLEKLYTRLYAYPQLKRSYRFALVYSLICVVCWLTYHLIVSNFSLTAAFFACSVLIACLLLAAIFLTRDDRSLKRFYYSLGFATIFLLSASGLLLFCVRDPLISPLGSFVIAVQTLLLVYLAVPCPLYVAVGCSLAYSILFEILTVHSLPYEHSGTKFALLMCFHALGAHLYVLSQVRDRKSFIKTGQSLLVRQDLEKEKRFIDNMIESVMPRKVAEQLLKGTSELRRPSSTSSAAGAAVGRGSIFRPFTMNLMTNVSILFADIAGFTKMSSNKSADELVDLLNDLFGRFDKLCAATGCEKISTLGDCYYCVAGCPEPHPDHAQCCVEMGLAMCMAIKEFDADRDQDVNMRVGIHTGTVMCGIVGTRRFKFDVFSNDVTLANTMESTGRSGRVHISEFTRAFLGSEYSVEDGEAYNGMKTYFVVAPAKTPSMKIVSVQNMNPVISSPTSYSFKKYAQLSSVPLAQRICQHNLRHIDSSEIDVDVESAPAIPSKLAKLVPFTTNRKSLSLASLSRKSASNSRRLNGAKNVAIDLTADDKRGVGGLQPRSVSTNVCSSTSSATQRKKRAGGGSSGDDALATPRSLDAAPTLGGAETLICGTDFAHDSDVYAAALPTTQEDESTSKALSISGKYHTKVDFTAHATSITRFDTAHLDFDERLVACVENSTGDEMVTRPTRSVLNIWTLKFNDPKFELEYRRHFSVHFAPERTLRDDAVDVACRRSIGGGAKVDETFRVTSPKYSVFIDVLIALLTYLIVSMVAFCVFGTVSVVWTAYFTLTCPALLIFVFYIAYTLWTNRTLPLVLTHWAWRHVTGLVLINLPLGAALSNIVCLLGSKSYASPDNTSHHLTIFYLIFVVLLSHCNFSQLNYLVKSVSALFLCVLTASVTFSCLCDCTSTAVVFLRSVYTVGVQNRSIYSTPAQLLQNESFLLDNFRKFTTSNDFNKTAFYDRKYLFHPAVLNMLPAYGCEMCLLLALCLLLIVCLNYQFEHNFRMSYFGDKHAFRTIQEMSGTKQQADWLLYNIVPHHIQDQLMQHAKYSENHEMVAVIFASVVNWHEMYEETFEGGREFLRVLNELVADFDELLDRNEFVQVEKIKTIGTTYMAAAGLNTGRRRLSVHPYSHLYELMEFAIALQETLENFNKDLLNFEFKMKIGYNIGPVTAGVIGNTKLYYDIWGDTVNVASRMYSTGVVGRIQASRKAKDMLQDVYEFEYRDHIEVKGIDGGMEVFLMKDRRRDRQPKDKQQSIDHLVLGP